MTRGALLAIAVSVALFVGRLFVPTVGHSWPMVFIASAHIFVGVMACLLWQRGWRPWLFWQWQHWPLGWVCLAAPSLLELALFVARS